LGKSLSKTQNFLKRFWIFNEFRVFGNFLLSEAQKVYPDFWKLFSKKFIFSKKPK